jgi:hypothetical protein
MMPRKPLPHPELYEQQRKSLNNVMPGAQPETKAADNGADHGKDKAENNTDKN